MSKRETVYVIGESRTNKDNAITLMYHSFYLAFVIDTQTDEIVNAGCVHTLDVTEQFVRSIFEGKIMGQHDKALEDEIKRRYHGTSQKAIIVSYKDALKKYREVKEKYYS